MEFIKAFEEIDTDESGEISRSELEDYMRTKNYKPAFVEKWLRIFDIDNSGTITLEEFCSTLGLVPGQKQKETINRRNTLKQLELLEKEKERLRDIAKSNTNRNTIVSGDWDDEIEEMNLMKKEAEINAKYYDNIRRESTDEKGNDSNDGTREKQILDPNDKTKNIPGMTDKGDRDNNLKDQRKGNQDDVGGRSNKLDTKGEEQSDKNASGNKGNNKDDKVPNKFDKDDIKYGDKNKYDNDNNKGKDNDPQRSSKSDINNDNYDDKNKDNEGRKKRRDDVDNRRPNQSDAQEPDYGDKDRDNKDKKKGLERYDSLEPKIFDYRDRNNNNKDTNKGNDNDKNKKSNDPIKGNYDDPEYENKNKDRSKNNNDDQKANSLNRQDPENTTKNKNSGDPKKDNDNDIDNKTGPKGGDKITDKPSRYRRDIKDDENMDKNTKDKDTEPGNHKIPQNDPTNRKGRIGSPTRNETITNYKLGKKIETDSDDIEIIAEDPDMTDNLRSFVLKLSLESVRMYNDGLQMAKNVKIILDANFKRTWHVVAGREAYGCLVTHEEGRFIHVRAREWGILMWQVFKV